MQVRSLPCSACNTLTSKRRPSFVAGDLRGVGSRDEHVRYGGAFVHVLPRLTVEVLVERRTAGRERSAIMGIGIELLNDVRWRRGYRRLLLVARDVCSR